jgi:hypothetical protein
MQWIIGRNGYNLAITEIPICMAQNRGNQQLRVHHQSLHAFTSS